MAARAECGERKLETTIGIMKEEDERCSMYIGMSRTVELVAFRLVG